MKNYYKILGLSINATDEQIRKNYRNLAKKYHPDFNSDKDAAASKFSDINEAYEVLSVAEKRKQYDFALMKYIQQKRMQNQYGGKKENPAAMNDSMQTLYLKGYNQGFSDAKTNFETKLSQFKAECEKFKENNGALNEIITSLKDKIENLESEINLLKDENSWLENQLDDKKDIDLQEQDNNDVNQQIQNELDELKSKLDEQQAELNLAQEQNKNLTKQFEKSEKRNNRLKQEKEELEGIIESGKAEKQQEIQNVFQQLLQEAQKGNAEAQNNLGEAYYTGESTQKDLEQALNWFEKSAKQGNSEAMFNLGICFMNGEGIKKDTIKGLNFIRQAQRLGSQSAKEYLTQK